MKRLNHFRQAQLKLTAQYFLVSLVIIILANILAIQATHGAVFPSLAAVKNVANVRHKAARANLHNEGPKTFRSNNEHTLFIRRMFSADAYLLVVAVGSSYLLSGLALKPIKQMVRRQDEFASDVSHELRTPLATIAMEIEALRRTDSKLPPAYSELLDSIEEETGRMTDTVSGLLTLVRPDAPNEAKAYAPLDLADIAARAIDGVAAAAAAKNISITTDKLEKAPAIGNEEQVRQAVLILLDNALRYTPNGGVIKLATEHDHKRSSLSVTDTGIGIPEQDQAKIFERFYRVEEKPANTQYGIGLGLAIAKKIVDRHGGTISVNSASGKGSNFTLNLPRPS